MVALSRSSSPDFVLMSILTAFANRKSWAETALSMSFFRPSRAEMICDSRTWKVRSAIFFNDNLTLRGLNGSARIVPAETCNLHYHKPCFDRSRSFWVEYFKSSMGLPKKKLAHGWPLVQSKCGRFWVSGYKDRLRNGTERFEKRFRFWSEWNGTVPVLA